MPKIFDRDVDNSLQTVDSQLQQMESGGVPKLCAIAENLRLDNRVSEDRSKKFAQYANDLLSAENLATVLGSYSSQYAGVEFRCPVLNLPNLLFAPQVLDEPKIEDGIVLVSVQKIFLSLLSKLSDVLRERENETAGGDDIGSGEESINFDEDNSYVNEWLSNLAFPQDLPLFATLVTEAYWGVVEDVERRNNAQPERICWAGRLDEFEPHRGDGLRRWMEIFGLGHHLTSNEWFMLLEYPLCSANVVARPTVLEAGANEWHFPFPGELQPELGGRTMVLGDAMLAGVRPMSEFVHNNRRLESHFVKALGRLDDTNRSSVDLDSARNHHRNWFFDVKSKGALV